MAELLNAWVRRRLRKNHGGFIGVGAVLVGLLVLLGLLLLFGLLVLILFVALPLIAFIIGFYMIATNRLLPGVLLFVVGTVLLIVGPLV